MSTKVHTITSIRYAVLRGGFLRAAPASLAVCPVSMLFGVVAAQNHWSGIEIFLVGLLGFTGSGQFAALSMLKDGAGLLTLVLVTASINIRYAPISYFGKDRLPSWLPLRLATAHMLGDEAYAVEYPSDRTSVIFLIRLSVFTSWVVSGLLGYLLAARLPVDFINSSVNFGFPASAVLFYLSYSRISATFRQSHQGAKRTLAILSMCAVASFTMISIFGRMYFWIPGIVLSTLLMVRFRL
jgi:predicted branched-subunit amino acid permease